MDFLSRDDIKENVVVIKINKSYREGMSAQELYDVTRGCWKRKIESVEKAKYALSVANGEVKEVYRIDRWVPAEQMERESKPYDPKIDAGRIAFFGEVADESVRDRYIGKNVNNLYKHGEADPVKVLYKETIGISLPSTINESVAPALAIQSDEGIIWVCPRCERSFIKAPRCPDCGQLLLSVQEENDDEIYTIEEIEGLYRENGLTFSSVKGSYRIMGKRDGSSLNLNKKNYVIYSTNLDYQNIEKAGINAPDLELEKNGNKRDGDRPNTVKCRKRSTLKTLLKIYAKNAVNKQ